MRKAIGTVLGVSLLLTCLTLTLSAQQNNRQIGINVVLRIPVNPTVLADLGRFGRVRDVVPELRAVTLQAPASQLAAILEACATAGRVLLGRRARHARGKRRGSTAEH